MLAAGSVEDAAVNAWARESSSHGGPVELPATHAAAVSGTTVSQKWPTESRQLLQLGLKAALSQPLKAPEGTSMRRFLSETRAKKKPSLP